MSLVSRVRSISCVNNFPRNLYGAPFVIYLEDITSGTRVAVRSHDTSLDFNAVTLDIKPSESLGVGVNPLKKQTEVNQIREIIFVICDFSQTMTVRPNAFALGFSLCRPHGRKGIIMSEKKKPTSYKTHLIVGCGMLAAAATALQYLEIPSPVSFIALDFSDLPALPHSIWHSCHFVREEERSNS